MDNKKNDYYYAEKAIEQIQTIRRYVGEISYDDFMADPQLVDAVMFRLVQLIENTKEISAGFKANHPEIPWGKIIGFRNGIVHEYGHTDYHVVYEVAKRDLADLEDVLQLAMDDRL